MNGYLPKKSYLAIKSYLAKMCEKSKSTTFSYYKHCQRHKGPRNWLRDLD